MWRTGTWTRRFGGEPGGAFQACAARRRRHGEAGPRRILADFVIGAHAIEKGYRLLTLDDRIYRAAFPDLKIVRI